MKHEIKILSDAEYADYQKQKKRQSFLNELERMSKPGRSSSFSIKDVKAAPTPKSKPESSPLRDSVKNSTSRSTDDWSEFMGELDENSTEMLSPIESVTDQRMTGYALDDDIADPDDKFGKVFNKELAMLSEVLKDVKAHGVRVNKELQKMTPTGKGAGTRSAGVSKGYSDLVEAYNSINTSKVQIIKTMADLRTKQMDWRLKEKAVNPDISQDTDTIADMYYKRIISGGTKNFVQNSMQQYTPENFEYDSLGDEDDAIGAPVDQSNVGDPSELDSLAVGVGFNITQPFIGSRNQYESGVIGDEYGNIRHEKQQIDICVYELSDGSYQFVAKDEDGNTVDDVELPSDTDPSILASLTIRPGSEYVYDKYNRKYRVLQMDGVDVSGIDLEPYPYDNF